MYYEFVFIVERWDSGNNPAIQDNIEAECNSESSYEGNGFVFVITHTKSM